MILPTGDGINRVYLLRFFHSIPACRVVIETILFEVIAD